MSLIKKEMEEQEGEGGREMAMEMLRGSRPQGRNFFSFFFFDLDLGPKDSHFSFFFQHTKKTAPEEVLQIKHLRNYLKPR